MRDDRRVAQQCDRWHHHGREQDRGTRSDCCRCMRGADRVRVEGSTGCSARDRPGRDARGSRDRIRPIRSRGWRPQVRLPARRHVPWVRDRRTRAANGVRDSHGREVGRHPHLPVGLSEPSAIRGPSPGRWLLRFPNAAEPATSSRTEHTSAVQRLRDLLAATVGTIRAGVVRRQVLASRRLTSHRTWLFALRRTGAFT
jgi:hypothetical protein